jgi:hypothetical protein
MPQMECMLKAAIRTVAGVPIVCLPIWHWYILRGDWLKSEKGVQLATSDNMLLASSSSCVKISPGDPPNSPSGHLKISPFLLGTNQMCGRATPFFELKYLCNVPHTTVVHLISSVFDFCRLAQGDERCLMYMMVHRHASTVRSNVQK